MPRARTWPVLAILLGLGGCVTVDATLEPAGSGTVQMTYRTPPRATEAVERQRFSSPHVTVDSITVVPDGMTTVKTHFGDATKLSTAAGFRDTVVTRERTGDEERLAVHLVNRNPVELKDEGKPGPKITFTLPGNIVEANEGGTVNGRSVTWQFGLSQYVKRPAIDLVVRYAAAAPSGAAATTQPNPAAR